MGGIPGTGMQLQPRARLGFRTLAQAPVRLVKAGPAESARVLTYQAVSERSGQISRLPSDLDGWVSEAGEGGRACSGGLRAWPQKTHRGQVTRLAERVLRRGCLVQRRYHPLIKTTAGPREFGS